MAPEPAKTLWSESLSVPHKPAKADKREGGGGGRQADQAVGRGAGLRHGSGVGQARVGRRLRAMALRPELCSILVADVPGAGRARYTVPAAAGQIRRLSGPESVRAPPPSF